jgi:hypothetical protein
MKHEGPAVNVTTLMRDIESGVRDRMRERLIERGGAPDYRDRDLFEHVETSLRRAVDERAIDAQMLPDLLGDEEEWRLQKHLRFSSHRPVAGGLILFLKRRLLLPATRWLYEYSLDNFRRQERVNQVLFACIEELAIENARLRQELSRLSEKA